jgi:hypothetical protein
LAIVLLLLLPSWVSARAEYFCRPMQRVVSSSCCPGAHAARHRDAGSEQRLRAADCCERLPTAARSTLPGTRSESDRVSAPPASTLDATSIRAAAPDSTSSARSFERSIATRIHGPPLFIANCALLN